MFKKRDSCVPMNVSAQPTKHSFVHLGKRSAGRCLPCSCQAPGRGPHLLLLLPYQPFLPHRLSPGFGPGCLGKKQLSEVTMCPVNPSGFPPCHLTLLSNFTHFIFSVFLGCFPFSKPLFPQDIPPLSSLGQLLLCPQESKQMPLSPGSLAWPCPPSVLTTPWRILVTVVEYLAPVLPGGPVRIGAVSTCLLLTHRRIPSLPPCSQSLL